MKPNQLRNIASFFYFTGTFVFVAIIALAVTGTASAQTPTTSSSTDFSSSSGSSDTFSKSDSSSSSQGSSSSSTSGSSSSNGGLGGGHIHIHDIVTFTCDFSGIEVSSITWYFGDGSSQTCLRGGRGKSTEQLIGHRYSTPGEYEAYSVTNFHHQLNNRDVFVVVGDDKILDKNDMNNPRNNSSLGLVGFLLLALGYSTHQVSRKFQIKA